MKDIEIKEDEGGDIMGGGREGGRRRSSSSMWGEGRLGGGGLGVEGEEAGFIGDARRGHERHRDGRGRGERRDSERGKRGRGEVESKGGAMMDGTRPRPARQGGRGSWRRRGGVPRSEPRGKPSLSWRFLHTSNKGREIEPKKKEEKNTRETLKQALRKETKDKRSVKKPTGKK